MAMHVYHSLLPIAQRQRRELRVSLLPNARSPFKDQSTDAAHRFAMLQLATAQTPLQICELELWQTPPVYSIDSLRLLRQRHPEDSLIFIMGMDSARTLARWKDGLQLTDYVHLWMFSRSERNAHLANTESITTESITAKPVTKATSVPRLLSPLEINQLRDELPAPLPAQVTHHIDELTAPVTSSNASDDAIAPLKTCTKGRIYIDPRPVTAVSSTDIRQQLQALPSTAISAQTHMLPLLNPTVYQYIIAHQLYSAAQFR